jgi:lysophospholipase L1-like esterase
MKMKRKIVVVALFVCLIFSNVSFAVTKWACAGDSITIGWKLKETDTYCYKLGVLLGSEYETSNFGHSARTMVKDRFGDINSYWDSPMFTDSQAYGPDIVTIMLGTNDANPSVWSLYSTYYYADAVDMINVYKGLPGSPRVILMTCPPCKNGNSRNPGILEINAMIPDIAADAGCEWVDVWTAIENSGLPDRDKFRDPIHLNGPAHTIIAELLYDYITTGGPVCGDGNCDAGEDKCSCPDDCGTPPSTETLCNNGEDDDCDGYADCADSDCDGDPACVTQPEIFSDDFESGSFAAGGWTIVAGNPAVHEQAVHTGVYGVKFYKYSAIEKSVSTVGYTNVKLEYDRRTDGYDPEDFFEVDWYDGSGWNLLESTQDSSWGHPVFVLPAAAENNPDFTIRFTSNVNRPTDKAYLDNVQLTGD